MSDYTDADRLAAVKRKLNVTWQDEETDARTLDAIEVVSSVLAARLGMERPHAFSPEDGEAWGLFLSACLYEFSDALDDFMANYAQEIRAARALLGTPEATDA